MATPVRSLCLSGLVLAAVRTAAASPVAAPDPAFSRYDVILERRPFGAAPAVPEPVPADGEFAKSLRLSAIYEMGDVIRAGLIDTESKRSLVLGVGESEDGIELVSVDPQQEEAVFRKNGETARLRLESGPPPPAPAPSRTSARTPAVQAQAAASSPEAEAERRQRLQEMLERRRQMLEALQRAQGDGSGPPVMMGRTTAAGQSATRMTRNPDGSVSIVTDTVMPDGSVVRREERRPPGPANAPNR